MIYKTLHRKTDRGTRTGRLLKTRCELKCSGMVWTEVLRKGVNWSAPEGCELKCSWRVWTQALLKGVNSRAPEGFELKCSGRVWSQVLRKGVNTSAPEGLAVVHQCQLLLGFFPNIVFEDLCLCWCMHVFVVLIFRQNLNKYKSLKKYTLQIWSRTNINLNTYFISSQHQTSEILWL